MTTPFPVPIHSRCDATSSDVMRTNENPNFPVPVKHQRLTVEVLLNAHDYFT